MGSPEHYSRLYYDPVKNPTQCLPPFEDGTRVSCKCESWVDGTTFLGFSGHHSGYTSFRFRVPSVGTNSTVGELTRCIFPSGGRGEIDESTVSTR